MDGWIVALLKMAALSTNQVDSKDSAHARQLRRLGRWPGFSMLYASNVSAVLYVAICTQGEWEEHEWSKMADHVQVSKALYFVIVEAGNLIFAERNQGLRAAFFFGLVLMICY